MALGSGSMNLVRLGVPREAAPGVTNEAAATPLGNSISHGAITVTPARPATLRTSRLVSPLLFMSLPSLDESLDSELQRVVSGRQISVAAANATRWRAAGEGTRRPDRHYSSLPSVPRCSQRRMRCRPSQWDLSPSGGGS